MEIHKTFVNSLKRFHLFEAVLQLFFLNLELPARFVELMHRPSALAELIQEVLDLLGIKRFNYVLRIFFTSARFLFSRLTVSRCSISSSLADLTRKYSELKLRHSV